MTDQEKTFFLRFFFYLIYRPFAWTYDWVSRIVSLGKWQDWILSVLPELKGPRVLELGHGPGHLQIAMIERGIWTCGLDSSKQMGRLAANRLNSQGLRYNLVSAQAQHLPFTTGSFSQIVATFPTEYIVDLKTLQEVHRVLCTPGSMIVMPVAWITGKGLFERAARWLFRVTGQAPEWDDSVLEPALNAGFQIEVGRKKLESSELLIVHALKVKV